jgi:hypothetical protein
MLRSSLFAREQRDRDSIKAGNHERTQKHETLSVQGA